MGGIKPNPKNKGKRDKRSDRRSLPPGPVGLVPAGLPADDSIGGRRLQERPVAGRPCHRPASPRYQIRPPLVCPPGGRSRRCSCCLPGRLARCGGMGGVGTWWGCCGSRCPIPSLFLNLRQLLCWPHSFGSRLHCNIGCDGWLWGAHVI